MESDPAISKYVNRYVGTSRGVIWIWTSRHVYHILEKLVGNFFYNQKYDDTLFELLYHDLENFCYDGMLPIRDFAPLHNFTIKYATTWEDLLFVENEPIMLDKDLRIKKISHEDNRMLYDAVEELKLDMFEIAVAEFAIECDTQEPIIHGRSNVKEVTELKSEAAINAVLTALRLFKSPFISCSRIFPKKMLDVFVELKSKPKNIVLEEQYDMDYILSKEEIVEFQKFWKDNGHILKEMNENKVNGVN